MIADCTEARLQLQELHDLTPVDRAALDAHLASCPRCRAEAAAWTRLDAVIDGALLAPASVRGEVRRRIVQPPRSRRLSLLPLWPLPIAVAAAILLFLFAPRLAPRAPRGPITVSAAWHVARGNVGYPVTVDRARPNHLLAGAFGRVFQSWNAGASWHPLAPIAPDLIIRAVAVDPTDARRYVAAAMHSVYLSTDAGRHWRLVADNVPGAENVFLHAAPRGGTFYLGPSVLWSSTDHGLTWRRTGPGYVFAPYGIQALAVAPNGDLWVGIWGGGVALSTNGGRTWQRRADGLAPKVLDVAVTPHALWAATTRGVYRSTDAGLHWRHLGPPGNLTATSILPLPHAVFVGERGGLVRYQNHRWTPAMSGLPLDPYVASLTADPAHPRRLYVSLNGDGLYRSDDGGNTWRSIMQGLPLHAANSVSSPLVLFLRGGVLWHTDIFGTDPGNLTVEHDVRLAAITPDGSTIAYLAGSSADWYVRVLSSGGSAAHTADSGTGPLPTALLWSPDSSLLAVVRARSVDVGSAAHHAVWPLGSGQSVLGWSPDARSLLIWTGGRIVALSRQSGHAIPFARPRPAVRSPDTGVAYSPAHGELALLSRHVLKVGTLAARRTVGHLPASCRLGSWSDTGLLLVTCASGDLIYSKTGGRIATLTGYHAASWVGGRSILIISRHGDLWRWSLTKPLARIVPRASPAT